MRRNFTSNSSYSFNFNSISRNHRELFFFVEKFIEFHFSKIGSEEEFKLRREKLLEEIMPPIINKIPKSGQSELSCEILSHLYLNQSYFFSDFSTPVSAYAFLRYPLMMLLVVNLSKIVSRNHREIFFPEQNPEEIEKDIEKACSEVVNYIEKKLATVPDKIIPIEGVFVENFLPIIFSTCGENHELILDEVFDYFSKLILKRLNYPHKELIEMEIIMDMTRLIMKT